ncbi:HD domain-containing protein [Lentzea fradiae]|uniref:HD domain-containing protein n=1 Tax=Lentzea fradiae TaxID=200378 RepID=UPI000B7F45FF|nr:HD domain-containing protein [Lentzea fradiae]
MDLWSRAFEVAGVCLADSLPMRWSHVQGVARQSAQMSVILSKSDSDLLRSAAILHDIGYSSTLRKTGFHPLDGARYLAEIGFPNRLCALVAHHSCAYREAELRGLSAELTAWKDEGTSLRDALWWADMTTTPSGEITNVGDRIEEIEKRYGPEDLVTFFIRQAEPELIGAVERTEARLRAAGVDYTAK